MFKPSKLFFVTLLTALVVPIAPAELVFEQSAIELHPALGDDKAIAHFKYQNKGDKPIAIKNVNTSCGCTAASAKQSAAPGEKGEVTATFSIGDRVGTQQKIITVMTDDPKQPMQQLNLTVVIPKAMEVMPTLIFWEANESPKPKTITAKVEKDVSVKNVDVASSSQDFAAKLEPGPAAGEYQIKVEPKATDKPIAATITIKPVLADGKSKMLYATARVMPPQPTLNPSAAPAATLPKPQPAAPPATAVEPKVKACSLLTSDEIKSVQGEALKEPKESSNVVSGLVNSQCYFELPTASNSISLTLTQRGEGNNASSPKEYWDKAFHRESKEENERGEKGEEEEKAGKPQEIDGVGDEAYWAGNRVGGALYVLKGDNIIRISVGGAGDEKAKIDKSKKLAKAVLKKL